MALNFLLGDPVYRIDWQVAFGKPNRILGFTQTLWERACPR